MNPAERAEWHRISRDAAYNALVAAGMPAEMASVSADVGSHAAVEAVETLLRVTRPLDGPTWINAVTVACGLAMSSIGALADDLAEKARAAGIEARQVTVAFTPGEAA